MRAHPLRIVLASAAVLAFAASPAAADHQPPEQFIALLNAPQEVPPILESNGHGIAFLTYDTFSRELCYAITYEDLTTDEIAAHIHGPAEPGVNAAVLFPISPEISPLGSPKVGCIERLTAAQGRDLRAGRLYLNVHTTEFPNGEIRGQILNAGASTQFIRSGLTRR